MSTARAVRLADPLPCVAWAGWIYCGQPATVALGELRTLATGHHWELRPYCAEHFPAAERAPARGRPARPGAR